MTARRRAPILEQMEKALSVWIDDCSNKRMPLNTNIIKNKDLKIYNFLIESGESATDPDFVASKGWFDRSKKRFSLQNLKIQGESTSADSEAAKSIRKSWKKLFNRVDIHHIRFLTQMKPAFGGKKMPKRTFISKKEKTAPGVKVAKDRLTLLMCSNASGDHVVKPMLVYKSLNQKLNKNALPVYWAANKKAWVTIDLFKKWFLNCLLPSAENHSKNFSHPNVEVIFLQPNTTSLLQPLDQGIISTFKSYYIRTSLQWILNKVEDDSIDVMQAWKRFTILDCINHISSSIKKLKPSTLNSSCWKNLWPEAVEKDNLIDPGHNEVLDAVVEVAKSVGGEGFDDMNVEDIQELLVQEEIDMVSLLEMASETNTTDFADDDDENNTVQDVTVIVKDFTVKELLEIQYKFEDYKMLAEKMMKEGVEMYKDELVALKFKCRQLNEEIETILEKSRLLVLIVI
nr:tigger transposable element-derived protein 1-like [Onthophagus taurus]